MVTMASTSPSSCPASLGFSRIVLLIGWSPATLSVEISTKRTGSVAVITVVTCSFTVSCSISSYVVCAASGQTANTSATRLKILIRAFILFSCLLHYHSLYMLPLCFYFLFSLPFTRYTNVPYFSLALFFFTAFDRALLVRW